MSNTPQNNTYMQKVSVSTLHFYKQIPSRKETQNLISVPLITHNIQAQKISLLHFYSCRNHTFKAQKHICIFPLQFCFPGFINCQFSNAQQKRQKREDWFTFIIPPDSINKDRKGKNKIKFIEKLLKEEKEGYQSLTFNENVGNIFNQITKRTRNWNRRIKLME